MDSFNLDISKLNKKITIEKFEDVQTTESGFIKEEWIAYKTVWASVNNLFGKEFYAAKAVNAENTIEFVVRYSKDLENINSKKYRIKTIKDIKATKEEDKYRYFNITFVDNIQYANKWLKIKTIETT